MKFTRGELIYLSVLVTTLVALILFHVIPAPYWHGGTGNASEENGDQFLWFGSAGWTAIFTLVLTLATMGMWFVMWRTLHQTKRSVDAFISAERGFIIVSAARVENFNKQRGTLSIPSKQICYEIENIGSKPATMLGTYRDVQPAPRGIELERLDMNLPWVRQTLIFKAGGKMFREPGPNTVGDTIPVEIDPKYVEMQANGVRLIFRAAVLYKTLHGEHRMSACLFDVVDLGHNNPLRLPEPGSGEHLFDEAVRPPFRWMGE